jgi:hypothetical protein
MQLFPCFYKEANLAKAGGLPRKNWPCPLRPAGPAILLNERLNINKLFLSSNFPLPVNLLALTPDEIYPEKVEFSVLMAVIIVRHRLVAGPDRHMAGLFHHFHV